MVAVRFLAILFLSSCAAENLNKQVPIEGYAGEIIYLSEEIDLSVYEVKVNNVTKYAVGLPYVISDTLINIGGQSFLVKAKDYGESRITIDNQTYDAPDIDSQKRASDEYLLVKRITSQRSQQFSYDLNFIPPIDSLITSSYGKKRYINEKPRSPHLAVDLRGAEGTPIVAPKDAKVALVSNHFYSGNIVILDHGGGLFTSYSHMQKHNVKEGDIVNKGKVIGFVGSTGRVTGPHLHWSIYLNENRINPEKFIELEYLQD